MPTTASRPSRALACPSLVRSRSGRSSQPPTNSSSSAGTPSRSSTRVTTRSAWLTWQPIRPAWWSRNRSGRASRSQQRRQAEAGQGADIEPETVLAGPVVLDVGTGVGPGPVEQRDQPVLQQVAEVDERLVACLAPPVHGVHGQMQRQRAAAAEQAEQQDGQLGRQPARGRRVTGEAAGRKGEPGFLAEP